MTRSFWQREAQQPHRAPPPVRSCDVTVVGGGVLGSSVAYWLSRLRSSLRVVLLEAGRLAGGASGRNAGFLLQGTDADYRSACKRHGRERARQLWRFTFENRDLLFSELDGTAFDLEASGSYTAAGSTEEARRLEASAAALRADGMPASFLSPQEANRRLGAEGFHGALYVPAGGALDPVKLVRHLAARSGAAVGERCRVLGLERSGAGVRLDTSGGPVEAGCVALCLGAHLPQLVPALRRCVRPVRAQMLFTAAAAERWLPGPVYSHDGYFYVRQTDDGHVLAGGARHRHRAEEVGYEDATTPALQADLETYLHRHFPRARSLAVEGRWSGTMGFSPDGLPVVGKVPGQEHVVFASGCTGHGLGFGFALGRLVARLLLGDRAPNDDLFTKGRPGLALQGVQ